MNRAHDRNLYLSIIKRVYETRDRTSRFPRISLWVFPVKPKTISPPRSISSEQVGFAQAYSFKYSERPGTPAAEMDQVPEDVKAERLARLQALLEKHQRKFNAACVDREVDVLFEKPGRLAGQLVGRSPYLQPVQATAPAELIRTIARVRILEAGSNSLFAELVPAVPGTGYPVLQAATGGA